MSCRAIIIDDDQDTVEVYEEYLKWKGIDVVGTGFDGKTAVSLYKIKKPDVVLLDVMMPDFDGFYALENIRKHDPNAKIVMATADKTRETRDRLYKMDANAIVYKPYEIDAVLKAIDSVLVGEKVYAEL
ncbi:response regulator [Nitrosopumilus sp. b1]|uniref:response regulator n=1 Tax=Nitrosopumilus sp. b1 TaxID=2109907 RepID=UPI000E2DFC92|nr:response regulator transcription factor [Nitrosopumilus sp. b1]RDJ32283.1 MAG: response regulator [Thermoproteota archaeon]KAF6243499.1 response regulator [Nitrosopumilus sp. b1]RDJ33225.1 MAG: response regulator [Thermoproteota archaeon]RDJ36272.1 MAG: response regulator [Thermoproteota archaeon]RDJ38901.1 MAG: response regulator [Thermoproteota archaeon]